MAATIVSVINQKGGTGKTTTTINLGSALSKEGYSVLLIDLDPQANLSYSLGLTDAELTLAEVFTGQARLTDILAEKDGLTIAPGSNELVDVEISLVSNANREYFLKEMLQEVQDFDFILIDCPPSLSVLTLNALTASHEVIIPLQMEVLTLQGLSQILSTITQVRENINPALQVRGIVIVMFDQRRKLSSEIQDYLQENIEEPIFETRIRLNVKLAEAPSFGKSILDYEPSSYGAKDYRALAREYLQK